MWSWNPHLFLTMIYLNSKSFASMNWISGTLKTSVQSTYLLCLISEILNEEFFFFSIWIFFRNHSRITVLQMKEEGISLTPHYHFHTLPRHLVISRVITAESSPMRIRSNWTQTENAPLKYIENLFLKKNSFPNWVTKQFLDHKKQHSAGEQHQHMRFNKLKP